MALDRPVASLIGIYKPRRRYTTDHVVDHIAKVSKRFESADCVISAVLRSRSELSWGMVAVYAVFELESQGDVVWTKCREVETFLKDINSVAEAVDVNWYETLCEDHKKGISRSELSKGDVVHLRGVFTEPDGQDIVSYSCLALLKAFFHKTEGLLSYSFYNSVEEGRKVVGLGVWQSELEAAASSSSESSPAVPYWKALGAKLEYGLYEVAYVRRTRS